MKKQIQYNHIKIEKKWQKAWEAKNIYKTSNNSKKKPYYVLDMFPYPSGQGLHVGHPRGYIGSDVFARMKRMQGFNVLHPMGFDAFGLPAEQYAIQTGKHPSIITKKAITRYKKQLEIIGFSYDWSREVQTIDPEYYKWTQWIFLQIYGSWYDKKKNKARPIAELVKIFEKSGNRSVDAFCNANVKVFSAKEWKAFSEKEKQDMLMKYRLAYEGYAEVNWCAELGTVLANDEVLEKDGKLVSERGDYPVERKSMRQWFMRITAYADRLISGLDIVDFADSTKETQKNWIGKSEGSEITFDIVTPKRKILIGTRNEAKFQMVKNCFPKMKGVELVSLNDIPVVDDSALVEGPDFRENARMKARFYFEKTGIPTISTDNVFWVEKWPKDNGIIVHMRKEANPESERTTDDEVVAYFGGWIDEHGPSKAHFIFALAYADHNGVQETESTQREYILQNKAVKDFPAGYPMEHFLKDAKTGEFKRKQKDEVRYDKLIEKLSEVAEMWFGAKKQMIVFTTRADTLFGVTYVVLAPEHDLVQELLPNCENKQEVERYIEIVKNKTQEERTESKEKTGVELKGVYAINPANGEQVPVWIADYVLASYGTGAVMAVPAHDERDFEFAKKYNLPITQVIVPDFGTPKENETYVNGSCAVVYSPEKNKFAILKWNYGLFGLIAGGQKDGEVLEEVIRRELIEEGGFSNIQKLERLWQASAHYYNEAKNTYRHADTVAFLAIVDESTQLQKLEEHEKFELMWVTPEEIMQNWNHLNESIGLNHWITFLDKALHKLKESGYKVSLITSADKTFVGNGMLTNSGLFNTVYSKEAKKEITKFVGGKFVTKYKMRDAIFARQRYWGEPIPLIQKPIEPKLEVEFSGNSSYYKLLKDGIKKIEVRALDKKGRKDVRVGGTLRFTYLEKKDSFLVVVKEVYVFKNISELYKKGKHLFSQIFPGETIDSVEALYERFRKVAPGYDKRVDKHGCVAWQVEKTNEGDLISTVSEKQLPLRLPNVQSYKPTGTGESPLAGVKSWATAGYETNTMPGWAGSSWYFLRYMDPKNKKALVGEKEINYWKNVDMYVGGTEHNTGHLLYARFWHKFLYDIGVAKTEEPFKALRHQGMIGGADGRKMSKRWGNVVNPDDVVKTYGADTLRVFEMFLGPFEGSLPWSTEGIIGSRRFVERVWRLGERVLSENHKKTSDALTTVLHKTIKKVTEDIQSFSFNTAVSSMMIFVNEAEKEKELSIKDFKLFLAILAPFASHMADELWQRAGEKTSIHLTPWPKYNQKFLIESSMTIAVQVNGKMRGTVIAPIDATQDAIVSLVYAQSTFDAYLKDREIKKIIYVSGKLVSFVV
jgi:leucyl-tRNA synthetase/ASC-1-like (ASCH) protein/ADP-ribose pyrophosphatase YjhB (NUDIX family)